MKFYPSATIAIYCLFTILFVSLFTHASDVEENSSPNIMPALELTIIPRDSDETLQFPTNKYQLHYGIKKQIIILQEKYGKNTNLIPALQCDLVPPEIQQNFTNRLHFLHEIKKQINSLQQKLPAHQLLHEIKKDILSHIFNQFLAMQDILILRQISKILKSYYNQMSKIWLCFAKTFLPKKLLTFH